MRRALLLTGVWVLGVAVSVVVAFAAVDRVANRVGAPGVARLSAGAVDRELGATDGSTPAGTSTAPRSSTTTRPQASAPLPPPSTDPPISTVVPSSPATTVAPVPPPPPRTTVPPPTPPVHDTATAAQGGTLWTRCSGGEHIVFVAAVPKGGFERTHDVEQPDHVEEWFESDHHVSKISAECSNGVVHAEVEEENGGD